MKTILITGASSGLGWELSLVLAGPSVRLIIAGRNEERLMQLQRLIEEKEAVAIPFVADLLTKKGQKAMVDFLEVTACDLLILNAGAGRYGRFTEVLIDDSTDLVELNVTAQMRLAHAWCRANTSGKIVFIASTASFLACPGMATYAASKAFILSFAEGLRFELRKTPLEVLTVCPGRFRSSFQERAALKSIPVEPSSREAAGLARKVARAIERKVGVYVPWPWNAMLMLKRLLPESFLMKLLEKTVLNRV